MKYSNPRFKKKSKIILIFIYNILKKSDITGD